MKHSGDPILAFSLEPKRGWRTVKNSLMTSLMLATFLAIALPLVLIMWSLIARGADVAFRSFPDFFTATIPVVSRRAGPGMGPAIVGTLLCTGGATLIAVPLGILGAVYLHEYGKLSKFARLVRFMAMVMTGVPSIVMGLFVYVVWTMKFGYSAFGGALALACLMLPIVIGATEQMLRLVPDHMREAAYALGASKSRVILTVVLPAALPGIVGAILLTASRAIGETMIVVLAAGVAANLTANPFEAMTTITVKIVNQLTGDLEFNSPQTLVAFALGLTLFALTLVMNIVALYIVRKYREQYE